MRIQIKILFLLLALGLKAQDKLDLSKALKVGQDLPVLQALPVLNYQSPKINWAEINDKVIILDFFDTYCSNCIRDMPKLQKLQDELSDKLQIVLVTWQDKETIEKFYANNAYLKKNKVHLPTIYGDTLLKSYFPHKGVPHTAWLFQNRIQAITFADFSTAENVHKLYKEGIIKLPLKADFEDAEQAFVNIEMQKEIIASVAVTGYQDGKNWAGIRLERDNLTDLFVTRFYNTAIFDAYKAAFSKIKKPEFLLKEERIVWKVKNPDIYRYVSGDGKNAWLLDHAICYERVSPVEKSISVAAKDIIQDLNNLLGLRVYWSISPVPVLVLQTIDTKGIENDASVIKGDIQGTEVLAFMIDYQGGLPPVVDEVKSKQSMDIKDYTSVEAINRQLEKYGLVLKEDVREVEVLVFEEVE